MQSTDWSPKQCGHRVLALGLVVLIVGSMFASVAAAQSAIGFRKAEVSATTVTVGENVTVSAEAVNVGDSGGGYTFEFERDRVRFERIRATIPANDDRRVSTNISFDEPGTYRISVNGNRAGSVTVQPARARVTSTNESQRRIDARANGVSATEPTAFDIPPSNRTFALQNWSTTTGQTAFQQYLTEYTNRSEVPGTLPSPEHSTLLGVIDVESDDGFEESTMRIGVNDSVLANSTLERDEVTVYQRNDTVWEPLSTSVAAQQENRTVYEATATRGTTYAVGRLTADIAIENTSYGTTASADGPRLYIEARLRNAAPIAGTYTGVMRVNGESVNRTTVAVPASGDADLSVTHVVTEAGSYNLKLNRTSVGSVFISESQAAATQRTESTPGSEAPTGTAATTATPAGDSGDDGDSVENPLPSTVFGINTLYVIGGLAIALAAFVAILLLLRRGGDGGGGKPETFDPF
ncbi:hypothetical protein [Haloarcula salinisoli]|uniref:PGF-pre-PGF domain-containing protein n=1 Tax=Haloarcula salinisoli TaxID=2487746 RepID=A0A8J7YD86_9EURY|nr:hypothetical protein [Halomicroarcula salinisoli]MBX0303292.1 hypothetical protein [Halomicroarcula salinisoli]